MMPDAEEHNPEPDYIREIIEIAQAKHSMSQRAVARQIGIGDRAMRLWLTGKRTMPYTAQYAIEQLGLSDV